jgi:myosin-crossreactive antigen
LPDTRSSPGTTSHVSSAAEGRSSTSARWVSPERDRLDLLSGRATSEGRLDNKRISDCFGEHFFTANFWFMWCTTFAFQPWHSSIEFRRHLRRFLHLFPGFSSMPGIHRTRYNQYDSLVRPLTDWLRDRGVIVHTGCHVTNPGFAPGHRTTTVKHLYLVRDGRDEQQLDVTPEDLVLVTNGSMTDAAALGSHTTAPPTHARRSDAWLLWHRLARGRDDFGNPAVFDKHVKESRWESSTRSRCRSPRWNSPWGTRRRARASMSGELSTPRIRCPRPASDATIRPVPHAASRTTPSGSASATSRTRGSSKSNAGLGPAYVVGQIPYPSTRPCPRAPP